MFSCFRQWRLMINEPAALLSALFEVQPTKSLCQQFELLHILLLSTQDVFVGSCAHNIELFHPVLKADVRWWASKSVWRMYGYVFAAFNTIEIEIVVGAWIQLLGHKQKGNIMVYLTFLSLLSDDLMSLIVDLKHVITKYFCVVASSVLLKIWPWT